MPLKSMRLFQKVSALPLIELVDMVGKVRDQEDYSLRARKRSNDEVGVLADSINNMLIMIDTRERLLAEANRTLEDKVHQRTHDFYDPKL